MHPEDNLLALGLKLPAPSSPAGNYATAVRANDLLFVSARAPAPINGALPKGRIGSEYSADDGYRLAQSACLDLLAIVKQHTGTLEAVAQFVELQGFLNADPAFEEHARVLDGASDLLAKVFGSAGIHARSVVGVSSLRKGVPLTLRAVLQLKAK
ncbi:MAG: RidA family protein [Methyloversatilis sp.]|nr:RidA family protein [Methyloversatilis sp.]